MHPVRHKRCVSETLKKSVAAGQRWTCAACESLLSAHFEVDHVVALWRGGTNDARNLQALCRECHAKKGFSEAEEERTRLEHHVRLRTWKKQLHAHFSAAPGPAAVPRSLVAARCGWTACQADAILSELGYATSDSPVAFPPMMWSSAWADAGVPGTATDFAVAGLKAEPPAARSVEATKLWESFRFSGSDCVPKH